MENNKIIEMSRLAESIVKQSEIARSTGDWSYVEQLCAQKNKLRKELHK